MTLLRTRANLTVATPEAILKERSSDRRVLFLDCLGEEESPRSRVRASHIFLIKEKAPALSLEI